MGHLVSKEVPSLTAKFKRTTAINMKDYMLQHPSQLLFTLEQVAFAAKSGVIRSTSKQTILSFHLGHIVIQLLMIREPRERQSTVFLLHLNSL